MTLEMTRVEIIGLKTDMHRLVRALHRFGRLQIDPLAETPEVSARPLHIDDQTLKAQEEHRLLVARIEGLAEALGCKNDVEVAQPVENAFQEARQGLDKLTAQVEDLLKHREELQSELASLPRYEATLRRLVPLLPEEARLSENVTVGVLVNRAHAGVLSLLEEQVQEMTGGRAALVSGQLDADTQAMLLVFPESYTAEIEMLLGKRDITRLRLPEEFGRGSPDSMLANLRSRLADLPEKISVMDNDLARLGEYWCGRLAAWRESLLDSLAVFDALTNLGETEQTFVLAGWLPARAYEDLEALLKREIGASVLVRRLPLTDAAKKRAPVVPQNPALARPFERLVGIFAYPAYGGLDPTRLMAIFLPLFFGMMLGDVGYGVLLVVLCLLLLRKFKSGFARDFIWVLLMGAGWAIVFGFLFGEAFGTLGEHLGLHPIWMERAGEEMTSLFILTLAVGVGHVVLGLVLGIWEAIQNRSSSHLLERGGMLVGITALLVLVGVLAGFLPDGWATPASAGIIVGIALLGAPMKWLGLLVGPIEFLGLIGNILSYLRIAAIGLASVYLAQVANDFAGVMGSLVVGVIIAVLIHALNLALGVFSPTIHSLRLHYVEFFRKFYEGGGRPYEPFRSRFERSAQWK